MGLGGMRRALQPMLEVHRLGFISPVAMMEGMASITEGMEVLMEGMGILTESTESLMEDMESPTEDMGSLKGDMESLMEDMEDRLVVGEDMDRGVVVATLATVKVAMDSLEGMAEDIRHKRQPISISCQSALEVCFFFVALGYVQSVRSVNDFSPLGQQGDFFREIFFGLTNPITVALLFKIMPEFTRLNTPKMLFANRIFTPCVGQLMIPTLTALKAYGRYANHALTNVNLILVSNKRYLMQLAKNGKFCNPKITKLRLIACLGVFN